MSKKVHTSKTDFKLFINTCLYYLELFGITEYEINFKHQELGENVLATTGWWDDRETKVLTFKLARNWGKTKITNSEIKATAFHEILHGFLCKLNILASERFTDEKSIDEECHILINRIMRAFSIK